MIPGHLEKQRQFLNILKYLSNELQISLAGAGIKDALRAVQTDPQLANPSNLAGKELATVLLSMSEGTIVELASVLCVAAASAIRTGRERIDEVVLKQIEWIRPSERKAWLDTSASSLARRPPSMDPLSTKAQVDRHRIGGLGPTAGPDRSSAQTQRSGTRPKAAMASRHSRGTAQSEG